MESEARYVRVGIATLILAALLAAGLVWLAGHAGEKAQDRYVVYFSKQSLEGLQINSDVRMQGIKVGRVVDYAILPGEAHRVRVLLQVDARTPVMEGVQAVVSRHLVTGLAAIDLENPPQATQPLTAVPEGEKYPVIPEGVSQLTRVTDILEDLSRSGKEALGRVNALLSDQNQREFASALANLNGMTGELNKTMPDIRAAAVSVSRAADQIDTFGADARVTLKDSATRLNRVLVETSDTLASSRAALDRVDQEMADLTRQVTLTTDLAGQDIQSTSQSLRQAGDALQDTGRALSDPARAFFGPNPNALGPGEEIRK